MTVLELRGRSCLDLDEAPPARKSILCSRSFGRLVRERGELEEAVAAYAARAAEKLRALDLSLSAATDYTPDLAAAALGLLRRLFRPGFNYQKAGVMLAGLEPRAGRQLGLFDPPAAETARRAGAMRCLDAINARFGRDTLQYAAAGLGRPWRMRQTRKSPRYTTRWDELPRVG